MAFQTVPNQPPVPKFVHMTLNLMAIVFGIVGLCAVFKFHNMGNIADVYSLHSWIGIGTFCLFGLQVKKFISIFMTLSLIMETCCVDVVDQ